MVSPTGAPSISLMPAMTNPTSPGPSSRAGTDFGVKRPSLSTWCARPVDITRILSPTFKRSVEDAHQRDDANVVVEPGVDDQRLQRCFGIALGLRDAFDEALEQFLDALARLRGNLRGVVGGDADDLLDFLDDPHGIGRRQVDLVDDGHHLEPELDGRVAVGDALRLDTLRRIHHQQRPVACRQRARHFIREVHVPGRVDEVQLVALAVASWTCNKE